MSTTACLHYVKDFTAILNEVIDSAPFDGSQRALALAIEINHSHLNRVLSGERDFSPRVVGRVARLLPKKKAAELTAAYLRQIAAEIAQETQIAQSK